MQMPEWSFIVRKHLKDIYSPGMLRGIYSLQIPKGTFKLCKCPKGHLKSVNARRVIYCQQMPKGTFIVSKCQRENDRSEMPDGT